MDDVLFTFDYNINVRKSSYSSYVDHAEQVDEDTIKVVLKEPGAYQWLKLVAGYFYVQPKHIWENIDAPKDYRGEDAVIGCGPISLSRWMRRRRPCTMRRLGRPTWAAP